MIVVARFLSLRVIQYAENGKSYDTIVQIET